jgi:hypothetical protein
MARFRAVASRIRFRRRNDFGVASVPQQIFLRNKRLFTAGCVAYQLCRGANRGNAEQNRKGTGGNQVMRKDDMASLKNWAG